MYIYIYINNIIEQKSLRLAMSVRYALSQESFPRWQHAFRAVGSDEGNARVQVSWNRAAPSESSVRDVRGGTDFEGREGGTDGRDGSTGGREGGRE